ncbi:MAG TPA: methyltransferase domain-containing protein [Gallionellaceae bacterium]
MPAWDPKLYLQFGDERTQPAIDLVTRVNLAHPAQIIDIGCGPGNSTAILRQRWPDARVTGLDSSPEMISAARLSQPEQEWVLADAASWQASTGSVFDLVFSNAVLQWIPDHARLIPGLLGRVKPSGALAFQMPARAYSIIHQLVLEVAAEPEWSHRMNDAREGFTLERPGFYYDLLAGLAARLDIWETEYCHVMQDHEAIMQWVRGTSVRPFLEALGTEAERQRFVAQLRARVAQAYPPQRDGKVLFPFRRLFVIAYR